MKYLKIILLLLFTIINVNAQYHWSNPNPAPHELFGIYFIDSLTGWTVGNFSTLLKTTDGGETWFPQTVAVKSTLRKVQFVDKNNGWIVGGEETTPSFGSVLLTTDGGENWSNHNPEGDYGWNDISVVSKDLIYIAGFKGVYKSTDGGFNWVKKGGTNWTTTVFFLDSLTGWFGNTLGGIYKTVDGGENWIQVSVKDKIWHKSIKFIDNKNGYLVSEGLYSQNGYIYKSTNGGLEWSLIDSLNNYELKSIEVLDSKNAIVTGIKGIVLKTTDGGENWIYENNLERDDYNEVKVQFGKTWIVGGGSQYGRIYQREEDKFVEKSNVFTKYCLNGIDFYNDQNGIAVGYDGTILFTNNSGKSWDNLNLFSRDIASVCYLNENFISMAGRNGEFIRSTNGGDSWSISYPFSNSSDNIIKFFSETVGYSLSEYGALLKTSDGGNTWFEISDYGMYKFFFIDSTKGWALTNPLEIDYSIILGTKDGGQTWSSLQFQDYVDDIFFLNENIGWLSSKNRLFKSVDGGLTWNLVKENLGFYINQLLFTSEERGYFLTEDFFERGLTSVKYTVNGGESFSSIADYTFLNYMTRINNKLWISGEYGHILEVNTDLLTSVEDKKEAVVRKYYLSQNYPNPFNLTTIIIYNIPYSSKVKVEVYNILGQRVRKLVDQFQHKGNYEISFHASELPSGVYIYRLKSANYSDSKKMLLLK